MTREMDRVAEGRLACHQARFAHMSGLGRCYPPLDSLIGRGDSEALSEVCSNSYASIIKRKAVAAFGVESGRVSSGARDYPHRSMVSHTWHCPKMLPMQKTPNFESGAYAHSHTRVAGRPSAGQLHGLSPRLLVQGPWLFSAPCMLTCSESDTLSLSSLSMRDEIVLHLHFHTAYYIPEAQAYVHTGYSYIWKQSPTWLST